MMFCGSRACALTPSWLVASVLSFVIHPLPPASGLSFAMPSSLFTCGLSSAMYPLPLTSGLSSAMPTRAGWACTSRTFMSCAVETTVFTSSAV